MGTATVPPHLLAAATKAAEIAFARQPPQLQLDRAKRAWEKLVTQLRTVYGMGSMRCWEIEDRGNPSRRCAFEIDDVGQVHIAFVEAKQQVALNAQARNSIDQYPVVPVLGIRFNPYTDAFEGTEEDTRLVPNPGEVRAKRKDALVVLVEAAVAEIGERFGK